MSGSSQEKPVALQVGGQPVYGVLHRPAGAGQSTALVFCHGWTGGRVGPHRMFVKAARRFAELGFACLRVDFRGRGDSGGQTAEAGIPSMVEDTQVAVDWLISATGVARVVLVGMCSGGKVAIAAAGRERRVGGLLLWSAEALGSLRNPHTNLQKSWFALRGYLRKLLRPATWKKILTGRVDVKGVNQAVFRHETRSPEEAVWEEAILRRFRNFRSPVLFIYGGNDPDTALAGRNYQAFCRRRRIPHASQVIPAANHSFYSLAWEGQVLDLSTAWLRATFGDATAGRE